MYYKERLYIILKIWAKHKNCVFCLCTTFMWRVILIVPSINSMITFSRLLTEWVWKFEYQNRKRIFIFWNVCNITYKKAFIFCELKQIAHQNLLVLHVWKFLKTVFNWSSGQASLKFYTEKIIVRVLYQYYEYFCYMKSLFITQTKTKLFLLLFFCRFCFLEIFKSFMVFKCYITWF